MYLHDYYLFFCYDSIGNLFFVQVPPTIFADLPQLIQNISENVSDGADEYKPEYSAPQLFSQNDVNPIKDAAELLGSRLKTKIVYYLKYHCFGTALVKIN